MSMVAFPFKSEDPRVALANLEVAALHPRVSHVLAVGAEAGDLVTVLSGEAAALSSRSATTVEVVIQDRIGRRRPGKGDGMNTAMRYFLDGDWERLHFYDADITNFDHSWIDGAERAADHGHHTVRHFFPRASTDAMITWMITRPVLALAHPDSALWRIRQPLGGELLLSREMVEVLAADRRVAARSDWGIDTLITYVTALTGHSIYEHYVPTGKQHSLYGSLAELRDMVHECFEAAAEVARLATPAFHHHAERTAPAPAAIAEKIGYDVETTLGLLTAAWSEEERQAAASLPPHIAEPFLRNAAGRPTFSFLDAGHWYDTLMALLASYRAEPGWRGVLFRLWVGRVLAYTTTDALAGHGRAMEILEDTVVAYARKTAGGAGEPLGNSPMP